MKAKYFSLVTALTAAAILTSCFCSPYNGLSDYEIKKLVDGPNSLKGKITGTQMDGIPYSFPYDYHVTTNDSDSYSEGFIDENGDSILYLFQNFFFDDRGYADFGDSRSVSGRYAALELRININSMEIEPLDLNDESHNSRWMAGMWQNITPEGNRFVFGQMTYCSCSTWQTGGALDVFSLSYDKNTQILSGKIEMSLTENNTVGVDSRNHHATTITGDFNIYIPRENFEVSKNSEHQGVIYRAQKFD